MLRKNCLWTILLISLLLFAACQADHEVTSNQGDAFDKADQISYNAKLTTTVRGKLSSVISYKRMERHSNKKYVYFYIHVLCFRVLLLEYCTSTSINIPNATQSSLTVHEHIHTHVIYVYHNVIFSQSLIKKIK